MKLFNRIIAILLIISLQACGAGTQSLLGNLGSKPNTSGPAVGPALSQSIEQAEQAEKQAVDAPTRKLDIVVPTFDAGLTAIKDGDTPVWPELRRAEANLFAIELKNALERTEKFGACAVNLADQGHDVLIVDNLSRRKIDIDLEVESLTPIVSIGERLKAWEKTGGKPMRFVHMDIAHEYQRLLDLLRDERPDSVVHFAEQRAAPYSMKSSATKRYTVDNNVNGTHNLLAAIVESGQDIHVVHLGTMGVYGYGSHRGATIPEGYLKVEVPIRIVFTDLLNKIGIIELLYITQWWAKFLEICHCTDNPIYKHAILPYSPPFIDTIFPGIALSRMAGRQHNAILP